jgi:hypothetical protein
MRPRGESQKDEGTTYIHILILMAAILLTLAYDRRLSEVSMIHDHE